MAETKPVQFGLIGIGGYAANYVRAILILEKEGLARLTSVAIRTPGKYPAQEQAIAERNLPTAVRRDFAEMIANDRAQIEIAAIPTGIDAHREQMIQAVEAGFDVVLEKPSTATIQDLDAMEEALHRTGKFCAIGYQSQYTARIMELKREICKDRIGAVREVIVKGFWTRNSQYYSRNAWAGKLRNDKGAYILDGTINNPMAHYLFNALYFASNTWGEAAMPTTVRAELYHANPIESEDTSCLEVTCRNGAKVFFYGTLAAKETTPITIEIVGKKGRATWNLNGDVAFYEGDKQVGTIDIPQPDNRTAIFLNAVRYKRGLDSELYCPLAMTRPHVLAVNGAFLSTRRTHAVPEKAITTTVDPTKTPHPHRVIIDIEKYIEQAAGERKLLSDIGVPWAVKSEPVSVETLKHFELPA